MLLCTLLLLGVGSLTRFNTEAMPTDATLTIRSCHNVKVVACVTICV